jgi:RES domain-containing protein
MRAWRIAAEPWAKDKTGVGAARNGGRWNSKGTFAIYLGMTPEICALEKLAHSGRPLPDNLVLVAVTLPDDPKLYRRPIKLPPDWKRLPPSAATAQFGDRILADTAVLGFFVPSVLMPESENLVLNPAHPAMKKWVRFKVVREFRYDTRL